MSYGAEQSEYYAAKENTIDRRDDSVESELERLAKSAAVVEHGIQELLKVLQMVLRPDEPRDSGLTAVQRVPGCELAARINTQSSHIDYLGAQLHDIARRVALA